MTLILVWALREDISWLQFRHGVAWLWATLRLRNWAAMRTMTQAAEEHNGTRKSSRIKKKVKVGLQYFSTTWKALLSCWVSSWKPVRFPRKEKTVRVGTGQEASWLRQQTGWLSGSTWFILFIFSVVAHYPISLTSSPYQLMAQLITLSRVMSVVIGSLFCSDDAFIYRFQYIHLKMKRT